MARYQAIGLEQVKEITQRINKDLIESIALYDESIFDLLKINVITDIENADLVYQFMAKGGTTRLYDPNELEDTTLGYVAPRKLQVYLNYKRVKDNIQEYREKEPFSILGTNNTYQFPNSEWRVRKIMDIYRQDVLNAVFFGDLTASKESGLKLYDGIYTLINQLMGTEISEANRNFINLEAPLLTEAAEVGDLWDAFKAAWNKLNPKLRKAKQVLCYMPDDFRTALVEDYMLKFAHMQGSMDIDNPRFHGMANLTILTSPLMGNSDEKAGAKLIFTIPNNIDFGCDNRPDQSNVMVDRDQNDFNKIIYQIQSAHGMRLHVVTSDCFAVTSGLNVPIEGMVGDYQNDSIAMSVNIAEAGTATVSPEKPAYAKGESVTLKAEAAEGYTFKMWSDGVTMAERAYVFPGQPMAFQAVFEKNA